MVEYTLTQKDKGLPEIDQQYFDEMNYKCTKQVIVCDNFDNHYVARYNTFFRNWYDSEHRLIEEVVAWTSFVTMPEAQRVNTQIMREDKINSEDHE